MELRIGPINAATPTPLRNDGAFDREAAKRLCHRWTDIGLDGVLIGLRTRLLNASQGTAIMHHRFEAYRPINGLS
jgi:hypothetical protein